MRYFQDYDRFEFEGMLTDYIDMYDLELDNPYFLESLLDSVYGDLKVHEKIENYEYCHKLKHFMIWASREF